MKNIRKINNCWHNKKESSGLDHTTTQSYWSTWIPILTTVHALNHWSTDEMVAIMSNSWQENINKAIKCAYPTFSLSNIMSGIPHCSQSFKLLDGSFKVWQVFTHFSISHEICLS